MEKQNYRTFESMKRIILFFLLLLPRFAHAQQPVTNNSVLTIDSFVSQKEGTDTLRYLNIFKNFAWDVSIMGKDGSSKRFTTTRVDTIKSKGMDRIELSASFAVSPQLVGTEFALYYDITGSVMMKLNGTDVLITGAFAKNSNPRLGSLEISGFTNFVIKDTVEKIEATYIPHPGIGEFFLNFVVFQVTNGYHDYYKAVYGTPHKTPFRWGSCPTPPRCGTTMPVSIHYYLLIMDFSYWCIDGLLAKQYVVPLYFKREEGIGL